MRKVYLLLAVLVFCSFGLHIKTAEASGMPYTVTPILPDNQNTDVASYVSLDSDGGKLNQTLEYKVTNTSDKPISVDLVPMNALTSSQGVIQYSEETEEDESRLTNDTYALANYIEADKNVKLEPNETKRVSIKLKLPSVSGDILGGIAFQVTLEGDQQGNGQTTMRINQKVNNVKGIEVTNPVEDNNNNNNNNDNGGNGNEGSTDNPSDEDSDGGNNSESGNNKGDTENGNDSDYGKDEDSKDEGSNGDAGKGNEDKGDSGNEDNKGVGDGGGNAGNSNVGFEVGTPYIDQNSSYFSVNLPITSNNPLILKDVKLEYEVYKGTGKDIENSEPLFKSSDNKTVSFAPNTSASMALPWNSDTFDEGEDYTMKGSLNYGGKKVAEFEDKIELDKSPDRSSNEGFGMPTIVKDNPWVWFIIGAFAVLIIGLIIFFIWKRKKKKEEEEDELSKSTENNETA